MMSVQSLRQRLSGNKYIAVALCVVLFSCNAFKLVPDAESRPVENDPPERTPDKSETPKTDPVNQPDNHKPEDQKSKMETVYFFGESYQVAPHKDQFRIALILPFYYDAETDIEKRTSEVMVDYYMGLRIALMQLEDVGFNLKLWVYDNKNDSNELKHILKRRELRTMDMVIGPIQTDQMNVVAEFGKEHDIPVFSPFTSMADLKDANSKFYCSSPNMESRADRVIRFVKEKHPGKKLVIIRDGSSYEKRLVPELISQLTKNDRIQFRVENYDRKLNWNTLLSSTDTTIVYIPTNQSVVVNSSLGKIFSTKRPTIVLGEDDWADFEDNDYNFWEALRVHLVATDFIDESDASVQQFRRAFRDTFVMDPSPYAYFGYDQMSFIGDILMAFGEHFPLYITDRDFRYLSSNFHFEKKSGFVQNTNVFILRFRENQLEPID